MIIHIEHPGLKIKEEHLNEMEKILQKRYGRYNFVKRIDVRVISEIPSELDLSLNAHLEKAEPQFVSFSNSDVIKALNGAIKKMNGIVERYKSKHYHGLHKFHKSARGLKG